MLAYSGNPVYLNPFNDRIYPNKWNWNHEIDYLNNKPIIVSLYSSIKSK